MSGMPVLLDGAGLVAIATKTEVVQPAGSGIPSSRRVQAAGQAAFRFQQSASSSLAAKVVTGVMAAPQRYPVTRIGMVGNEQFQ